MMKAATMLAGAILVSAFPLPNAPALAQLDPAVVAQGQVLRSMNQGYADRARRRTIRRAPIARRGAITRPVAAPPRGVTRRTVEVCANKARFRAQYGSSNAKVRQLYLFCQGFGL